MGKWQRTRLEEYMTEKGHEEICLGIIIG